MPPAECELAHQYPLQLLLPCLMSLGNLLLVFEEPLLCLFSKFSDHCINEGRKRNKTQLVRTLAWKSQAFFPKLCLSLTLSPILDSKGIVCIPLLFWDPLASMTCSWPLSQSCEPVLTLIRGCSLSLIQPM